MNMRQDVLAMSRHKTPALACFLVVCMGLLLFWGLHAHAQSAEETSEILEIELLQRDIRYISGQLIKLRQQTTQTGKDQQELGKVLREEIDAPGVQWMADAAVPPGGCLVESAGTVVDGSLGKRWQRAIAALGLQSPWEEEEEGSDGR
mgnify:CR=1 FL=1